MPDAPENSDSSNKKPEEQRPDPAGKPLPEVVEKHDAQTDVEKLIRGLFGEQETKLNARLDAFEKSHPAPVAETKKEGSDGVPEKKEDKPADKPEDKPAGRPKSKRWRLWREL